MTITPKPEQEHLIVEAIQAGLIHSADEVLDFGIDTLRSRLRASHPTGTPLSARIRDIWRDMPEQVRARLPEDGASQVDHYVYGLPKSEP